MHGQEDWILSNWQGKHDADFRPYNAHPNPVHSLEATSSTGGCGVHFAAWERQAVDFGSSTELFQGQNAAAMAFVSFATKPCWFSRICLHALMLCLGAFADLNWVSYQGTSSLPQESEMP